jgi:hypothetical protein
MPQDVQYPTCAKLLIAFIIFWSQNIKMLDSDGELFPNESKTIEKIEK